ncbi:EF-hand domain-containing protein [Luteolibacter pohnpeiensis]|uniref:EF-hand domain-containing protein n=1 Tax=Luteolibacter pohnpeiensis TaxID=454153 RepID=A0A934S7M9_9BACT|nr:EF-hand domain-containing protein [Luteolibacter pohnpeiensis]MBK1881202.1 EF-hand domain-containing protein [Luteolibacter pohnpeiensis]
MKPHQIIPVIIAGLSVSAFAQGGPNGPPKGPRHPDPLAVVLDADHDHELSAAEIEDAANALLKLDKDGDGAISEEELHPKPSRGERGGREHQKDDEAAPTDAPEDAPADRPTPPKSELLTVLDADDDGTLSKEEIAAATEHLKTLDADSDGIVDDTEAKSLSGPDRKGPPGGEEGNGEGRPQRGPRR